LRGLTAPERARRVEQQLASAHLEDFASRYPASRRAANSSAWRWRGALAVEPRRFSSMNHFPALDTHLRSGARTELRETLETYQGSTLLRKHNLEEVYRVCEELVVLTREVWRREVRRKKSFAKPPRWKSRVSRDARIFPRRRVAYGLTNPRLGLHAPRYARVRKAARALAIRANHIRVRAPERRRKSAPIRFPVWPSQP